MILCQMWYFSIIVLRTKYLYPAGYWYLMMGPDVLPFNKLSCSFIYSRVMFGDKIKFSYILVLVNDVPKMLVWCSVNCGKWKVFIQWLGLSYDSVRVNHSDWGYHMIRCVLTTGCLQLTVLKTVFFKLPISKFSCVRSDYYCMSSVVFINNCIKNKCTWCLGLRVAIILIGPWSYQWVYGV